MKGTTKTGFVYEFDDEKANDWELLEILESLETSNLGLVALAKKLLGKEQYEALKEHCRSKNGVIHIDRMEHEITDIFTSNKDTKN